LQTYPLVFVNNMHGLVESLGKKLDLLPPHQGGIEITPETSPSPILDVSITSKPFMDSGQITKIRQTGRQ